MSVPEGGVEPIAVVGLSGRLVGHSVDSPPAGAHEDAVDARYIDADALGLSAREAQVVAPPQRVSLESRAPPMIRIDTRRGSESTRAWPRMIDTSPVTCFPTRRS
jgi:hypothetical protein